MRRKVASSIIAAFLGVITWLITHWLEVSEVITQENSYWLLYIAILCSIVIVFVLIWGFWPIIKQIRFRKYRGMGTDYFSGHVYVAKVRAGAGLEVMAKIGDYESTLVKTNAEGYYFSLEVTPPDDSYRGRIVEFYVGGQKALPDRKYEYMGGGHGSNRFNLGVESEIKDKIEPIAKEKQKETASQIHDEAMGEHITRIVELLNIWKEQLSLMIEKTELDDFVTNIERDSEFQAILQHIPSMTKKSEDLRLSRAVCEMKLNPISLVKGKEIKRKASKQEIAEDKRWLNGKMQLVVDAVEKSLKSSEYTKTRCDWCPRDMLQS